MDAYSGFEISAPPSVSRPPSHLRFMSAPTPSDTSLPATSKASSTIRSSTTSTMFGSGTSDNLRVIATTGNLRKGARPPRFERPVLKRMSISTSQTKPPQEGSLRQSRLCVHLPGTSRIAFLTGDKRLVGVHNRTQPVRQPCLLLIPDTRPHGPTLDWDLLLFWVPNFGML